MRIVIDVTPLSQPRTGIGNYLLGMLRGTAEAAGGQHELVAFAVVGPRGAPRVREAVAGLPVEQRVIVVGPSSQTWRTAWSRLGFPKVERLVGKLDVFHFSDWMYPAAAQRPADDDRLRPLAAPPPGVGGAAHPPDARP